MPPMFASDWSKKRQTFEVTYCHLYCLWSRSLVCGYSPDSRTPSMLGVRRILMNWGFYLLASDVSQFGSNQTPAKIWTWRNFQTRAGNFSKSRHFHGGQHDSSILTKVPQRSFNVSLYGRRGTFVRIEKTCWPPQTCLDLVKFPDLLSRKFHQVQTIPRRSACSLIFHKLDTAVG